MARSNPIADNVINPECVEDIEQMLLKIWPDGKAELTEFAAALGITNEIDINTMKHNLGLGYTPYPIRRYADYLWENSNYGSK